MDPGRWTAARYQFGGPSLRAWLVMVVLLVLLLGGLGIVAALSG